MTPTEEIRDEPSEAIEPVDFRRRGESTEDELDMTPMVDVTFLLLIFFMVTAAFAPQKSLRVPAPDREESAAQAQMEPEELDEDDYVIVEIHADNTIFVDDREAPNEQELLVRLREARQGPPGSTTPGPSSLLVKAHGDCRHETVVMALDAGNAVGMENVKLATADDLDF